MSESIQLAYSPYSYQCEVHASTARFRLLVGGRRVGKSKLAMQEMIKHCLTKENQLCWWVAPTYKEAREIGWEEFMAYADVLKPAIEHLHHSMLRVRFINGSTIYFKGSDKFDSLRGRGLDFVVMDEAAFCHEDAWKKAVRPALSDKRGRALFTSTPNGRNWYYDQFYYATHAASGPLGTWKAWHWPTWMNPLITEEDLIAAKQELSNTDFRQEYGAEFITKAGMVYDDFNDSNIIENDSFKPDRQFHDFYLGLDFGYASATAICFMAVERATNKVCMFDEIYVSRHDVEQIAQLIIQKVIEWKIPMPTIYCDPAGNAEELCSGISPVDYLREKGFNVVSKGTKIAPGLSLVRAYVLNAFGQRRLFVTKRCKWAIKSFYGYSYKLGVSKLILEEPEKDNIHDHMMDAIRYFFVNKFDNAKWLDNKPNQYNYAAEVGTGPAVLKRCGICHNKFVSHTPKDRPPFACKACEIKGIE